MRSGVCDRCERVSGVTLARVNRAWLRSWLASGPDEVRSCWLCIPCVRWYDSRGALLTAGGAA